MKREERGETVIHAVREEGTLVKLLREFLEAYKARTEALSKLPIGEISIAQKLDAIIETQTGLVIAVADVPFIKEEVSIMHGLTFEIKGKVETMSSNIDRIEKEAVEIAEDVTTVKEIVSGLKSVITDLKAQVAAGQVDQARLDAAATSLEKIDDNLDAMSAPEAPPEG